MQQEGINGVEALGRKLSLELDCPVIQAAYGKNVLVCHHNKAFSITRLEESDDWFWARELHEEQEAIHS